MFFLNTKKALAATRQFLSNAPKRYNNGFLSGFNFYCFQLLPFDFLHIKAYHFLDINCFLLSLEVKPTKQINVLPGNGRNPLNKVSFLLFPLFLFLFKKG